MIQTVILIPLTDNDGEPFPSSIWHQLQESLLTLAGGYSEEGPVSGAWRDQNGRVYRDKSLRYTVSLNSWTQFPEWLRLVDDLRKLYRQEALYIEVNGSPEIIG